MVTRVRKETGTFYLCDVCGHAYLERKYAEQCESWCREHGS